MHNGFIDGFATIKRDLVLAVDESLYPEIKGQTDTEVLFNVALSYGSRTIRLTRSRARSAWSRRAGNSEASSTRSRVRSQRATVSA